jgi:hypothetical protein
LNPYTPIANTTNTVNFWDPQFSSADFKCGTEHNAFLRSHVHQLPSAARVLVPGDRKGRNSVCLATQGQSDGSFSSYHAIGEATAGLVFSAFKKAFLP